MSPYLYLLDYGPSSPVMLSGARSIPFLWDKARGRHIWRPSTPEAFEKEAAQIIRDETMWKILPGLDLTPVAAAPDAAPGRVGVPPAVAGVPPETSIDLTTIPTDALHAELHRRNPPQPAAGAPAAPTGPKEISPGQSEDIRVAARGEAGGGEGAGGQTPPKPKSHKKKNPQATAEN